MHEQNNDIIERSNTFTDNQKDVINKLESHNKRDSSSCTRV